MPRSFASVCAQALPLAAAATIAVFAWIEQAEKAVQMKRAGICAAPERSRNDDPVAAPRGSRLPDAPAEAWRVALRLTRESGAAGVPVEAFERQIASLPLEVVTALVIRRDVWDELPAYGRRLVERLAHEAPAHVARWLDEIGPADPRHEIAAGILLPAWLASSAGDALEWFVRMPAGRERTALGLVAAAALARREPALAADLLSALPATFDRDAALQKLFHDWAAYSPYAALEAVPRATALHAAPNTRAVVFEGVLVALRARAPAEAARLAQLISLRGAEGGRVSPGHQP